MLDPDPAAMPPRPVWTPPFARTVSLLFDVLLELDDDEVVVVGAGAGAGAVATVCAACVGPGSSPAKLSGANASAKTTIEAARNSILFEELRVIDVPPSMDGLNAVEGN
jgi:hypothetical protein